MNLELGMLCFALLTFKASKLSSFQWRLILFPIGFGCHLSCKVAPWKMVKITWNPLKIFSVLDFSLSLCFDSWLALMFKASAQNFPATWMPPLYGVTQTSYSSIGKHLESQFQLALVTTFELLWWFFSCKREKLNPEAFKTFNIKVSLYLKY